MSAACPRFGFVVTIIFADTASEIEARSMIADLIETLEANDLVIAGGGDRVLEYVVDRDGDQATDADRQLVAAWADRWRDSAAIRVSELVDLDQYA